MPRGPLRICLITALMTLAATAFAQGGPSGDASATEPAAPSATGSTPLMAPPVIPSIATKPADDRPARGPAMRERGGRRTRGGSSRGVLMIVIVVGAMGYYVMKKLRR